MVNDGEVQETRQPAVKLEEDNGNRRQPTVGMGAWTGIGEFHEQDGETWADYIERFEFACIGQGVEMDDVTKRARLLSGLGQEGFRKVKTILAPCQLSDVSFEDIKRIVQNHMDPKPSVIVSRFQFHKKVQGAEQGIKEFVAELRVMAGRCDFGNTMDLMLRDRFVCGLYDQVLQKRLLSEEDSLTFERAQKIALAVETAAKGSRQLTTEQPSRDSREVNRVEARSFNPPPPPAGRKQRPTPPPPNRYVKRDCYRCGGSHSPQMCRFKGYRCHSCGALGHLSRCCRQNEQDKQPATRTNRVGEDGTDEPAQVDDESEVCSVYTVGRQKSPPITAEVMVCGVPVTFEVDTGAASTLMNKETFEAVRTVGGDIGLELQHSEAHLRTYTGERIPVEGEFSAVIRYDGQHLELPALVVDTTGPNLLGRDWLRVLKLNWQDIKQEAGGGTAGGRSGSWYPGASSNIRVGMSDCAHCEAGRYRRLAFGVSSAVGIFQREMERLLAGVPGAFIYLDDILLCGHDEDELLQRLERVLRLFQEAGLKHHHRVRSEEGDVLLINHLEETGILSPDRKSSTNGCSCTESRRTPPPERRLANFFWGTSPSQGWTS
ncbi:uncharacterized protein LOC122379303 isoform X2 [Amphibalanus amphitrite]|uniref:uncharacterized protein LOC122379303 isoform X2 n=1 Tax=Amphibalanus amphitrite TaxID=1232801 RepID=UPI001C9168BD|nr:uncharacterized protein LOC122379303 isoform X2 [Amphibalanus amphitrite]